MDGKLKYSETTLRSETKFKGKIITVRQDEVQLCNGKTALRDIVEHPGGVAIVAVTEEQKILMVKQFRKPYEEEIWELPAGKLDIGEDHRACGIRELEEETGYLAGNFLYLGHFYPSPGFCDEKIHIYYADRLSKGKVHLDEDEFLDVAAFTQEELLDMIFSGEIKDSKTVIGILLAKEKKAAGKLG